MNPKMDRVTAALAAAIVPNTRLTQVSMVS